MYKKALVHFKRTDPILYKAAVQIDPFELSIHPNPFVRLTRAIVGQQLSVKAAKTIFERTEKIFPENKITPTGLINISSEKLRSAGLSFQKISYLKDLGQKIKNKEIDINNLNTLPADEITKELIKVKGIGVWTSEMFLIFSLGRPDIFAYGDLGLQNAIKQMYNLENKPDQKQMEILCEKWKPFRSYASIILWKSLNNEPK